MPGWGGTPPSASGRLVTQAPPTIVICEDALEPMWRAGEAALPKETGGILVGFRSQHGIVVTRAATVFDPDSSGHHYQLRDEQAQQALDDLRLTGAALLGYVGDWHTHPADQPPSSVDLASLRQAARTSGDVLAQIVLAFRDRQRRQLHGATALRQCRRMILVRHRIVVRPAQIAVSHEAPNQLEHNAHACWTEGQP